MIPAFAARTTDETKIDLLLSDLFLVTGSIKAVMVELRGLEPLTPSMPWRCATSCATAPCLTAQLG